MSIFGDRFKQLDQFGHEFKMNMQGDTSINSGYGAFISLLLALILIAYTGVRIHALHLRRDTIRSSIIAQDYINETIKFNFKNESFHLAFAVEDYDSRQSKDDSDYVEWVVRLKWKRGKETGERPLTHHLCTPDDHAKFF
jgi:hypothetical protein